MRITRKEKIEALVKEGYSHEKYYELDILTKNLEVMIFKGKSIRPYKSFEFQSELSLKNFIQREKEAEKTKEEKSINRAILKLAKIS